MRIVFMGTPDFAIPALKRLIESPYEILAVVTQPSRPKGRGKKIVDPPVKTLADERGLAVLQPKSLIKNPIDEKIRDWNVDVIVVAAYGKILPDALLEAPRFGCLNIHPSLLPAYRGAAPIQRALMDGLTATGVTIIKLVTELDAGPIIARREVEIHEDDDTLSLSNMLSALGADLLLCALDDIGEEGIIEGEEQDDSLATYAPAIEKDERFVRWDEPSEQIVFCLRGMSPVPGLFMSAGSKRIRIVQAEPLKAADAEHLDAMDDIPPGTVSAIMPGYGFAVRTGDGHLLLIQLQPEAKHIMDASAYMNGHPVNVGQKLDPESREKD